MADTDEVAKTFAASGEGLLGSFAIAALCLTVWRGGAGPVAVNADSTWQVFIAPWTHATGEHLLTNMAVLAVFSLAVGRWTIPIFVAAAIASNMVWVVADMPDATGASGGVFAVVGAAVASLAVSRSIAAIAAAIVAIGLLGASPEAIVSHGSGFAIGVLSGLAMGLRGKLGA